MIYGQRQVLHCTPTSQCSCTRVWSPCTTWSQGTRLAVGRCNTILVQLKPGMCGTVWLTCMKPARALEGTALQSLPKSLSQWCMSVSSDNTVYIQIFGCFTYSMLQYTCHVASGNLYSALYSCQLRSCRVSARTQVGNIVHPALGSFPWTAPLVLKASTCSMQDHHHALGCVQWTPHTCVADNETCTCEIPIFCL